MPFSWWNLCWISTPPNDRGGLTPAQNSPAFPSSMSCLFACINSSCLLVCIPSFLFVCAYVHSARAALSSHFFKEGPATPLVPYAEKVNPNQPTHLMFACDPHPRDRCPSSGQRSHPFGSVETAGKDLFGSSMGCLYIGWNCCCGWFCCDFWTCVNGNPQRCRHWCFRCACFWSRGWQVREGKVDPHEVTAQPLTEYADPLHEGSRSQKLTLSSFRDFSYGNGYGSRSDKDTFHSKGRGDIKVSHQKPPVEYADPLQTSQSRKLTLSSLQNFSYGNTDRTRSAARPPAQSGHTKPNVYQKKDRNTNTFSAGGWSSSTAKNDFMHFKSHDWDDSDDFANDDIPAAHAETKNRNLERMYVFLCKNEWMNRQRFVWLTDWLTERACYDNSSVRTVKLTSALLQQARDNSDICSKIQ